MNPPSPLCVSRRVPSLRRGLLLLACWLSLALSTNAADEPVGGVADWSQFLGPHRTGISAETGLLQSWPAAGPAVVWRARGGVGMSGLAIQGGHVVTLVQRENSQWALALDAATGKQVWRTRLAPAYANSMGNGPRATPGIDGEQVFTFTGEGILTSLKLSSGDILWSQNVVAELKGEVAEYGMASSPLVHGGQVLVTAGAPGGSVAAFDVRTGQLTWKSGNEPAGYSSPTLFKFGGREQVVAFTGAALLGLTPQTGELLWRYPFETDYDCNIAAPVAVGESLFISAGENHGCVLLDVVPDGERFRIVEKWQSQGTGSVLRNEWQTSILHAGHLYGFDNVGAAGPVTHLTCINAMTGERVWQAPRFGKGNLIAADGKLWISTISGELVLARLTPTAYEELGRMQVLGPTRQAPALAGGRLYLRDEKEIVCLDVRQK